MYRGRSGRRSQRRQEQQNASVTWLGVTDEWVTSIRTFGSLSVVDPAEHPRPIRSLHVLLFVVLSAWVLEAALRLSSELAS